jgi:hypothetical protein
MTTTTRTRLSSIAFALFSVLGLACGSSSSKGTPGTGNTTANLIVNGNAEAAAGSPDGTPVATPGWTSTGEATAIQYGVSSFPAATDPGPSDRGMNFFVGGIEDATSSLEQTVDVSAYATAIDGGKVTFNLSGWLGGFEDQEDNAVLTVTFQSASGSALGSGTIGPVTAEDRNDVTEFVMEAATGAVPAGTRSVDVLLTMTRTDGSNNDGYADDLALTLSGV